jgi:hypothetical protein
MEASQAQTQQPDTTTLAALVVILMGNQPVRVSAPPIGALLGPLGISLASVTAALELLTPHLRHELDTEPASAAGWVARTANPRRAAYLVNAAKRIEQAVREGTSIREAVAQERRYLVQHLAAERGRKDAAAQVDAMAAIHGTTLGWYSRLDDHTSAGCRAAHGSNFSAINPPIVEGRPSFPGAVHPSCRCKAGAPHLARVREPMAV